MSDKDQIGPETEKRKRRKLLLLLAAVLCLGAVIGGTAIHIVGQWSPAPPVLPPDVLPEVEERAVPAEEGEGSGPDSEAGGGSVNMTFSDRVNISLADREARFLFATPLSSDHSMVLELLIRDRLILRSGALPPGSGLESLPLLDNATLQPGGYDGVLRVSFYDPDTGERAAVNAEIPVKVTVGEGFSEADGM